MSESNFDNAALDQLEADARKFDFETDGAIVLTLIRRIRDAQYDHDTLIGLLGHRNARIKELERVRVAVQEALEEWRSPRTGELDLTGEEGLLKVVEALEAAK